MRPRRGHRPLLYRSLAHFLAVAERADVPGGSHFAGAALANVLPHRPMSQTTASASVINTPRPFAGWKALDRRLARARTHGNRPTAAIAIRSPRVTSWMSRGANTDYEQRSQKNSGAREPRSGCRRPDPRKGFRPSTMRAASLPLSAALCPLRANTGDRRPPHIIRGTPCRGDCYGDLQR